MIDWQLQNVREEVWQQYNLKRHYTTKHWEQYKYIGDDRKKRAEWLQKGLLSQQELFHKAATDADAALEASYVVSELIAKAGEPFTEVQFLKDCMLRVADIPCPKKKGPV